MTSATHRLALFAAVASAAFAGGTGCRSFSHSGKISSAECGGEGGVAEATAGRPADGAHGCRNGCPDGNCPNGGCPHGEPPKRWSDEWYALRACDPVSARQVEHCGKQWPPYPRPCGEKPEFSHIYHAAHYWPYPYVCDDRAYVRSVLALQEQNGWTEATTLYEYHFDADTQQVNQPGRLHLRWILQNPRPEYRLIYVQTADTPDVTQARLDSARAAAIELAGEANLPPIMPRVTDPLGRPAREIDLIQRAIFDTVPQPRIQYNALPSGAGGGGT
ncbi:MAG: hypothetical protein WD069_12640 [Planctomycetales bacterium]